MEDMTWRTSSHSSDFGNCVEVADLTNECRAVRDSKCPSGPVLTVDAEQWAAFAAWVSLR